MDRVSIKNKAKEMIKDNKWYIWKPLVYFLCFFVVLVLIVTGIYFISSTAAEVVGAILDICLSLISGALAVWYAKYLLDFVRGKKVDNIDYKEVLEFVKKNWVKAFLISLVVGLNIMIGSILLIVPGIMATFGLMFYQEVHADNLEMSTTDILKRSWAITNGHKMDLFIMMLSFIGWELLAELTLGILYIWLMPYMIVAFTLAYEYLKETTK